MAFLRVRLNGEWTIGFRYNGTEFHRSCCTASEKIAKRLKATVEETLEMLKTGRLVMPEEVDRGAWILSGGKLQSMPTTNGKPQSECFGIICDEYIADQRQKQTTTLNGEKVHIRHLKKIIKPSMPVQLISFDTLKQYQRRRQCQKFCGTIISDVTIKKEIVTFRQIWMWARQNGYVETRCPLLDDNGRWKLHFQKPIESDKFQTWQQIERRIRRGGLSEAEVKDLWIGLYLDQTQVCELLEHVKANASYAFIYPLFAVPAYTGARRSEVLRSEIEDFDFQANQVRIRERKRRKDRQQTTRVVPLHPKLRTIMEEWLKVHPGGPFTIQCPKHMPRRGPLTNWRGLSAKQAHHHFEVTLRRSKWKVVRGFHVLRHSFGSNLVRSGKVSSDIVAKWMGHSTEEMKELYQHLFPQDGVEQISILP